MRRYFFFKVLIIAGLLMTGVARSENTDDRKRVGSRVQLLTTGNADEKLAASDWLFNSAPDLFPIIEDIAKHEGQSASGKALAAVLEKLKPFATLRTKFQEAGRARAKWMFENAMADFEKYGQHDPASMELVRQTLKLKFSNSPADQATAFSNLKKLTSDLHCEDPFIWYLTAREMQIRGDTPLSKLTETYSHAWKSFQQFKYPGFRQVQAMLRWLEYNREMKLDISNPTLRAANVLLATRCHELISEAISERDCPDWIMADLLNKYVDTQVSNGQDFERTISELGPMVQKSYPGSFWFHFAGHKYIEFAWQARGDGRASFVSADRWSHFSSRLAVAQNLLTQGYERDPANAAAATGMLTVALNGHSAEDMNLWFKRAITADPVHANQYWRGLDAYVAKLIYLQPKWHGSQQEAMDFAHECAATRNYIDGVVFVLIEAHVMEAESQMRSLNQSDWDDMKPVLQMPLNANPDDLVSRNRYAYWAYRCRQWKVADDQLKILGGNLDIGMWGGAPSLKEALNLIQANIDRMRMQNMSD